MSNVLSVQFAMRIGGRNRILFSISSRPGKPLIVGMRPSAFYRAAGSAPDKDMVDAKSLLEQKYSIHQTNDSKYESNCIHHTLKLYGEDPIDTWHYTQAMKKFDNFAVIFAKRFGYLDSNASDPSERKSNILIIDNMDQTHFTLYMMMIVCKKGRIFRLRDHKDLKVIQWDGHDFSIVLIWSYIITATHNSGFLQHAISIPIELWEKGMLDSVLRRHIEGHDESGILELYRLYRRQSVEEMIATIEASEGSSPEHDKQNNFLREHIYSRSGMRGGPEYDDFVRRNLQIFLKHFG